MNTAKRRLPSKFSRGPFPIPPRRKVANEFHRIFSIKAGMRTVSVESSLEADAIYWAEANPKISSLCEQPLRIHAPIGNKPFFTFDLSLRWDSGAEIFYEIKPETSLEKTSAGNFVPKHWESVEEVCRQNSYTCQVLTDRQINKISTEISNWRRLLPIARAAYQSEDPKFEALILSHLQAVGKSTIFQIITQLPDINKQQTINHIAKLIHQGRLLANLNDARLTGMTVLSVVEE